MCEQSFPSMIPYYLLGKMLTQNSDLENIQTGSKTHKSCLKPGINGIYTFRVRSIMV